MRRLFLLMLLATPAQAEPWAEFPLIMWHDYSATRMEGLRRMGFTGTKVFGSGGEVSAEVLALRRASGMPFYLENIATDFYAPYHRWTPGRSVTWLFDAAKVRQRQDPADTSIFVREPGLSDPAWLAAVAARLDKLARTYAADRPLFYNLADEPGICDLAAAWDADIAPSSLDGMRAWLQTQYADLGALNRQWGTAYAEWSQVMPELTNAAMARTDDNYSAWADFKAWMDVAFARALRTGTDALHRADPAALSAIEGGQVPGWGGYDYGRLAGSVDVMEIYDAGNAVELAQAFNPALITLRTSFGTGPAEMHAAWRSLLLGTRGIIVWDEADTVVNDDGSPGPRGRELSELIAKLRTVAPVLQTARPHVDPVAILYSQSSFRTRWMLDQRLKGAAWSARDAEREYDDNAWRAARRQASGRLAELGVMPRWLSSQGVEAGALQDLSLRVLVLPHAIALSDAEVSEIRAFAARGGTVLADTEPGVFDGHSRRRAVLPRDLAILPLPLRPDADPSTPAMLGALAALLQAAGAAPGVAVQEPDGAMAAGVDVRRFTNGGVTVLALQAAHHASGTRPVHVPVPPGMAVRGLQATGLTVGPDRAALQLDGAVPAILVLSPAPLPGPVLSAAMDGNRLTVAATLDGPTAAATTPLRLRVLDPDGQPGRSSVLGLPDAGRHEMALDRPGRWTVEIVDLLSGRVAATAVTVPP